jgi:predicted DNA-binding transcriptional regulator YafY
MATNKNALLRYKTLDRCFQNTGRGYNFEELLNEVNLALTEDEPNSSGINVRQLREDIRFMRSNAGYNAPIETKIFDSKKHIYFYSDPNFSIYNSPLNETEAKQMKGALELFQRFSGSPGFEWVEGMNVMLKNKFGGGDDKVISFESNIDYTGYHLITPLFNAIVQKKVLWVTYTPFNGGSFSFLFHPYFLKQYNGRWFILGLNEELGIEIWTIPLDRIHALRDAKNSYIATDIDWDYHFSEIIGVTRYNKPIETIELLFNDKRGKYVETKPLHESQRNKWTNNGFLVTLKLIPNLELEEVILSYGEDVEVLNPKDLREKIETRVKLLYNLYT